VLLGSLTSPVTVNWWAIVLDGFVGAFVGGAFASGIALWIAKRSKQDQRELAREQAALAAAESMAQSLLEARTVMGDRIGQQGERPRAERLAAAQQFDCARELKSPALIKDAPYLLPMLATTSDVLLGYSARVETVFESNTRRDATIYGEDELDSEVSDAQQLKLAEELHTWTLYVLSSLGAFRSGTETSTAVEPPAWKIGPNELGRRNPVG
jgi:hypothetical protein